MDCGTSLAPFRQKQTSHKLSMLSGHAAKAFHIAMISALVFAKLTKAFCKSRPDWDLS